MLRNIKLLKISSFIWGLSFYVPIVALFYLENGVSLSAIVLSQVSFAVLSFLGEVPTGIFADKIGQKSAILAGYGLGVIAFILMLLFPTTAMLFIVYGLRGLANAFLSGSTEAVLYESDRSGFKRNLGGVLSYAVLGTAVGAGVTAILLAVFGTQAYSMAIILSILANLVCFGLSVLIADPHKAIRLQNKGKKALQMAFTGLGLIRKDKTIWALALVGVLTLSGEYTLYSIYQPYFEANSVSPFWLGLVMSLGAILNFVVLKYVYLLEKHLTLQKIIALINILIATGYLVLALIVNPIFLVLGFIFTKGLFNAEVPIVNDYIHERVEGNVRATVSSGISFFQSTFQIIARIILAVLVATVGISNALLAQGLYMLIGISIGYWLMVRCGCVHRISSHYSDPETLPIKI